MIKGLRFPIVAFLFALVLLSGAVYVRFIQDSDSNGTTNPTSPDVSVATVTPTLAPTDTPSATQTPVPTIAPLPVADLNQPQQGQFIEGLIGHISKLNPLYAGFNVVDRDISSLIFEGLTTINHYGELAPALAEQWGVSPDGLDYVFALRRDVLWHDGVPFTSTDVKYTIDVIRSGDFQGEKSLTQFWRTVEMTVVDDYNIRFRLVQPLASFPEYLRLGILPEHVYGGFPVSELDRHQANLDPIGTGPYQFEALLADQGAIAGVVLRLAPTYLQRNPETVPVIDRFVFRTFETPEAAITAFVQGDINSIAYLPPVFLNQMTGIPHMAIHTTIYPSVGFIVFNWKRDEVGYFRDQRARLALAEGVDRATVVNNALPLSAVVANSPLIPGSWAYDSAITLPVFDQNSSRSRLDDLSFELDVTATPEATEDASATQEAPTEESNGEEEEAPVEETSNETDTSSAEGTTITMRKTFSILVSDKPDMSTLATNIANEWNTIGFTVEVESVDDSTFRQRLQDGDFDAAIVEYTFAPFADPDSYSFWHVGQFEDGLNYGGVRDLQISKILEQARRETIGINRTNFYHQFQELFSERLPAIPLYYPVYSYVVDDRLDGVQLGFISTPADRFRTLSNWKWHE